MRKNQKSQEANMTSNTQSTTEADTPSGSESPILAGVDLGGTNIEIGLVNSNHEVIARGKKPTPKDGPSSMIDTITEILSHFDQKPAALGIGIPGAVHEDEVIDVPNLPGWKPDLDLGGLMRKKLGIPVALGNDVNVGLLGEWLAGSARGHDNVLGVWLGTGIGGGLIVDGKPFNGARGAAGEIGHVIVHAGGELCDCGRRGCAEAYAGRRKMTETVQKRQAAGRASKLFAIQQDEGKPTATSKVWAHALENEDPLVVETFEECIEHLGLAIGSALNLLDLELVVIGGGMAEKLGKHLAKRIKKATLPWVLAPNPKLDFVTAALGDDSGVIGAASLAKAALLGG